MVPAGFASQPSTSGKPPLERFWSKLAEIAIVRDMGSSRDLSNAIAWLQQNTLHMQRQDFTQAAATGHLLAGELYSVLSRFDLAAASYWRALRLSPKGSDLRCSSMSHLARAYATTGHLQDALKYSQNAMEAG